MLDILTKGRAEVSEFLFVPARSFQKFTVPSAEYVFESGFTGSKRGIPLRAEKTIALTARRDGKAEVGFYLHFTDAVFERSRKDVID